MLPATTSSIRARAKHAGFADGLLTYKTSGDRTSGHLALAEVNAPRGCGSPRTGVTTKTRPTALTRPPMDLPARHQRDAALLAAAAAQVHGLDIVEP